LPRGAEPLANRRFALTVGTFEIRKNYALLIDLWHDLVLDPTFDLDLVIVGMPGWKTSEAINRLKRSPLFGKRIFWFQGVSDAALSWFYDRCHVFLFPSFYEGWGMPVAEAMSRQKPAIVSSRGAIPEASPSGATMLDPGDADAWRRAIREASINPSRPDSPSIRTWDETAASLKTLFSTDLAGAS